MKKRQFLAAGLLGMSTTAIAANKKAPVACSAPKDSGPVLLTLTGAIGAGNRGALDPALDQMMAKQKLQFNRAHTFDFAALSALPQTTIKPTLEYDNKQHVLSGPLLVEVLKAAGASAASDVLLRAVDGYAVQVALADIRKYRFIVATHLDGKPIPLGGLGPLWAVYEPDSFPDIMEKPISARFALCPWGTYHIEAKA